MMHNDGPDAYQALHPATTWGDSFKCLLKRMRFYLIIFSISIFAILSFVQYLCYNFGTYGCDVASLSTYNYPFGDDLLPNNMLLVEENHLLWKTFMVTETDVEGVARKQALGYFYQIWGPFQYITGFRDPFGHTVFASTVNIFAIGSSKEIYRCDGRDEIYTLAEGTNWLLNRFRRLLGMFTATEYDIWRGSTLVAISDKVGYSSKNLLIHAPQSTSDVIGSASLVTRDFHGKYDEWVFHEKSFVINSTAASSLKEPSIVLPTFVSATATALMAFHVESTMMSNTSPQAKAALPQLASASAPNPRSTPSLRAAVYSAAVASSMPVPEQAAAEDINLKTEIEKKIDAVVVLGATAPVESTKDAKMAVEIQTAEAPENIETQPEDARTAVEMQTVEAPENLETQPEDAKMAGRTQTAEAPENMATAESPVNTI